MGKKQQTGRKRQILWKSGRMMHLRLPFRKRTWKTVFRPTGTLEQEENRFSAAEEEINFRPRIWKPRTLARSCFPEPTPTIWKTRTPNKVPGPLSIRTRRRRLCCLRWRRTRPRCCRTTRMMCRCTTPLWPMRRSIRLGWITLRPRWWKRSRLPMFSSTTSPHTYTQKNGRHGLHNSSLTTTLRCKTPSRNS